MRAWFSDEPEEKQAERCQRLLSTMKSKKIVNVAAMREAVTELTVTGQEKFDDLKQFLDTAETEALITSRFSGEKAPPEQYTPAPLKALRPPKDGCVLSWQIARNCFAGYYPREPGKDGTIKKGTKKHHSCSRTYGERWSKLEALTLVVKFLWRQHGKQHKDDSGAPEPAAVQKALTEAMDLVAAAPAADGKSGDAGQEPPKKRSRGKPAAGAAKEAQPAPETEQAAPPEPNRSPSLSSVDGDVNSDWMDEFMDPDAISTDSDKKTVPVKHKAKEKKVQGKAKAVPKTSGKMLASSAAAAATTLKFDTADVGGGDDTQGFVPGTSSSSKTPFVPGCILSFKFSCVRVWEHSFATSVCLSSPRSD